MKGALAVGGTVTIGNATAPVVPVSDGRAGSLVLVRPGTLAVPVTGIPPVMTTCEVVCFVVVVPLAVVVAFVVVVVDGVVVVSSTPPVSAPVSRVGSGPALVVVVVP